MICTHDPDDYFWHNGDYSYTVFYVIPLSLFLEIVFSDFLKLVNMSHQQQNKICKECHSIRKSWEFLNEKGVIIVNY
jgi:hypothetical protein